MIKQMTALILILIFGSTAVCNASNLELLTEQLRLESDKQAAEWKAEDKKFEKEINEKQAMWADATAKLNEQWRIEKAEAERKRQIIIFITMIATAFFIFILRRPLSRLFGFILSPLLKLLPFLSLGWRAAKLTPHWLGRAAEQANEKLSELEHEAQRQKDKSK